LTSSNEISLLLSDAVQFKNSSTGLLRSEPKRMGIFQITCTPAWTLLKERTNVFVDIK